jgi:large subunit ribosomal protein L21e
MSLTLEQTEPSTRVSLTNTTKGMLNVVETNLCSRTGIVFNVTPHAVGIIVNKRVGGRILAKRINIRIEHIKHSKSREGFLKRVVENRDKLAEAKKTGKRVVLKRSPVAPKGARFIKVTEVNAPETVVPVPYEALV